MSTSIQDLLGQVPAAKGSEALGKLDAEVVEILDGFAEWLQSDDGKTQATARAYKSYVATALVAMQDGESWDSFSTDVRSGVRAFQRFSAALAEAAKGADEVEAE